MASFRDKGTVLDGAAPDGHRLVRREEATVEPLLQGLAVQKRRRKRSPTITRRNAPRGGANRPRGSWPTAAVLGLRLNAPEPGRSSSRATRPEGRSGRSGETPVKVLADTIGKLLVDGYSGYNKVTLPGGRERAGCLAHLRRKFFEAQAAAPEAAKRAMDFILEVYKIERAALDNDLLGTSEHLQMRQTASRAVMGEFKAWLDQEQGRHPPRGPMGQAIGYALGQWDALTLFLTDAHLPIDNNASERALRVAALGRKNFLFVGTDEAGENLAGLYSLIATCEANGVNPVEYLGDVLIRVQTHPASRVDELLPHNWTPPRPEPSA
jgi:transposase